MPAKATKQAATTDEKQPLTIEDAVREATLSFKALNLRLRRMLDRRDA